MQRVLPTSFLFRFAFPVTRVEAAGAELPLKLADDCRLAFPGRLDDATPFADVKLAWNSRGLGVSVEVAGKSQPPECNIHQPAESDGLQVWIDTRDTQTIHRAGRFCHHFCMLPTGTGRKNREPAVIQQPIARAKEDAPQAESAAIPVFADVRADGYRLDVWFPAATLHGFDPDAVPRLGFYYLLRDRELGDQALTVGSEFPYAHDPSMWSTLELTGS